MLFIQTYYRLHSQKLLIAFAIDNRVKMFVYESRGSKALLYIGCPKKTSVLTFSALLRLRRIEIFLNKELTD